MALVALTASGCLLSACNNTDTAPEPRPDLAIPDSERAKCPESPFKPEYPIAPKTSALQMVARPVDYDVLIYTSRGKFIREMMGVYDPDAANTGNVTILDWDGRDAAGKQVPSGYYFVVMTLTDPASGFKKTSANCVFMINDADRDKLK